MLWSMSRILKCLHLKKTINFCCHDHRVIPLHFCLPAPVSCHSASVHKMSSGLCLPLPQSPNSSHPPSRVSRSLITSASPDSNNHLTCSLLHNQATVYVPATLPRSFVRSLSYCSWSACCSCCLWPVWPICLWLLTTTILSIKIKTCLIKLRQPIE